MAARVPVVAYGGGGDSRDHGRGRRAAPYQGSGGGGGHRPRRAVGSRPARRPRRPSDHPGPSNWRPSTPDRLLRRIIDRAAGDRPPLEIQVQGPFETSYSLAVMNRRLALGLDRSPGQAVSIYATEGPGDYRPAPEDLARHPEAAALCAPGRGRAVPRRGHPPDVPAAGDRHARRHHLRVLRLGGEPHPRCDGRRLQRATSTGWGSCRSSSATSCATPASNIPIRVVGNGVEPPDPTATVDAPELVRPPWVHLPAHQLGLPPQGRGRAAPVVLRCLRRPERRDTGAEDLPQPAQPGRRAAGRPPVRARRSPRRALDRP